MLISKHFDPVIGIDIHILIIPPVGPVPIPHPHIALVFDPFDYVPFIGATVKVGGLPRSTAGTAGKPIPHIPMGGPFAKPPMNENEIFMGSVTVLADGGPLSYTAVPSLSCHDIGLIAPPRKKKPKKSFGMVLPTSVVLSIPLGMPVMVGGAPTIDMMGLAMMGGFAALGGAFKKLRKMQKKSKRMKKMSNAIHKRAKKAMDKLGVPPNVRNKVHKGICTVTGHPVDVATGKMFTDHIDFELPGPLPLVWERTWYSTSVYDGPLGHGWHHSYDVKLCEMDNAVAVRLADGRSIAFPVLDINEACFDRQERMTLLRDEEGYALDTSDRQRYRFTPFQGQKDNQLLTSLSQTTSGAAINFYYNDKGQLNQLIDSGGRLVRLSYTDDNRIHKIYLPEPESNVTRDHTNPTFFCAVEHHYRDGMLVQVDDALQQPLHYHYDHKLLIKETFRSGLSFYFEYDGLDHNARCLRTWGDEGIYYRDIRYDTVNNITYVKNSLGHVTTYYHNGVLPHRVVDPLNHASLTEYNEYSEITKETNELGHTTKYKYDENGNNTNIYYSDGSEEIIRFDKNQNPIEFTDAVGSTWKYFYNDKNLLIKETDPLENQTLFDYDGPLLSRLTESNGNYFQFRYDTNLNIGEISEAGSPQVLWRYDSLGNLISTTDNLGAKRKLYRDALGRVIKTEEADGNACNIDYDTGDNIVHTKDLETEVFYAYTGFGCISSRTERGTTVRFEYDTEEQLTGIINEHGRIYHFEFDPNGEIISESGFDSLIRKFVRDASGQTIRVNRPNDKNSLYTHDAMGRVTHVKHSDGSFESYQYLTNGQLIKAANNSSKLTFDVDKLGRITKEHSGDFWISSEYDQLGFRTKIQSSFGLSQNIERNYRGDVAEITVGQNSFRAHFERNKQGYEIHRSLPGGINSRWTRDKLGRPLRHEVFQGAKKGNDKTYLWGINDRLLKIVDAFERETVFQRNPLGSLLSARYSNGDFELRMPDAVGNLFKTQLLDDRQYGPAGQLLAIKSPVGYIHYEYDPEGNLVQKIEPNGSIWKYVWNGTGMLSNVIRPDGKEVKFEYDAIGRRIKKSYNGKITHWLWDGDNPLHEWIATPKSAAPPAIESINAEVDDLKVDLRSVSLQPRESQAPPAIEKDKNELITWLFEPESFSPIAKLVGDNYYSIISDHIGTPFVAFDKEGKQVWGATYNLWGEISTADDKEFCPFRWPGQYEDIETGFYYNRFRYYDPNIGQYISQDPIGLLGGLGLYSYVDDPTVWTDPLGLAKSPGGCGTAGTQRWKNKRTKTGRPYKKPGPKTNPRAPHNRKIRQVIRQEKAKGKIHIGGGSKTELIVKTPNGKKPYRRMDASFRDPTTGKIEHHNVGLSNRGRGDPIARERDALDDVRTYGPPKDQNITFHSYGTT
jgi:RHS repeat-associated protein